MLSPIASTLQAQLNTILSLARAGLLTKEQARELADEQIKLAKKLIQKQ